VDVDEGVAAGVGEADFDQLDGLVVDYQPGVGPAPGAVRLQPGVATAAEVGARPRL